MKKFLTFLLLTLSVSLYAQRTITPTDLFTITGAIEKEKTVTVADLQKYKQEDIGDLVIKNHKGQAKDMAKNLKGVLLKTILTEVKIITEKPKELAQTYFVLIASDGNKIIYSWSELFNTEVGNHVYILTSKDEQQNEAIPEHIMVCSMTDINSGMRYFKALSKIEVRKAE